MKKKKFQSQIYNRKNTLWLVMTLTVNEFFWFLRYTDYKQCFSFRLIAVCKTTYLKYIYFDFIQSPFQSIDKIKELISHYPRFALAQLYKLYGFRQLKLNFHLKCIYYNNTQYLYRMSTYGIMTYNNILH